MPKYYLSFLKPRQISKHFVKRIPILTEITWKFKAVRQKGEQFTLVRDSPWHDQNPIRLAT